MDALLVVQRDNVGWLTGFTGSSGFVLVNGTQAIFATDSRYLEQAKEQCIGYDIQLLKTSAPDEITTLLATLQARRIGFEADTVTVKQYELYRSNLAAPAEMVPAFSTIESLRLVKDVEEIAAIEAAVRLADRTFDRALSVIKPGACERDIMLEMEWFMRRNGADVAFDTIVASGPRGALPHGRAADRIIQTRDMVTLDFGAKLNGYCSDITRTIVVGRPTDEQRRIHAVVTSALHKSIESIRPGVSGKSVDSVARDYLAAEGYDAYFGHGLGHSLGRAVHDGPGLSMRSEVVLAPNMVMTVEPGIYIPGWGGVRIEHDVVVEASGARILDNASIELLEL